MPQTIHRGIKALIDEANAEIDTVSAAEAIKIAHNGDVVIVDIRDPREIERDGRIPGAFACTRGRALGFTEAAARKRETRRVPETRSAQKSFPARA